MVAVGALGAAGHDAFSIFVESGDEHAEKAAYDEAQDDAGNEFKNGRGGTHCVGVLVGARGGRLGSAE